MIKIPNILHTRFTKGIIVALALAAVGGAFAMNLGGGHPTTPPSKVVQPVVSAARPPVSAAELSNVPVPSAPDPILVKATLYLQQTALGLDKRVQAALQKVEGLPRQLLAEKYYLRHLADVRTNWTWTPKEFQRYKRSKEYALSLTEVQKVRDTFALRNPGYFLDPNLEVRTLEDQLASWNTVPSVAAAADGLMEATHLLLVDSLNYPVTPDKRSLQRFRAFLANYKVVTVPTVAVPGFSQHGQLRAFDFVVKRGNQLVAGTETANIHSQWDSPGWTKKLSEAVAAASTRLHGPLAAPREPWHYGYM